MKTKLNTYHRKLLTEKFKPTIFIREHDISVISYDLVTSPSFAGATIGVSYRAVGLLNEPIQVQSAVQMREIFGDV
tara:strand:+ start:414 stop:641 length:228 start_codon:yes stop_codon:yes gene_type:complete